MKSSLNEIHSFKWLHEVLLPVLQIETWMMCFLNIFSLLNRQNILRFGHLGFDNISGTDKTLRGSEELYKNGSQIKLPSTIYRGENIHITRGRYCTLIWHHASRWFDVFGFIKKQSCMAEFWIAFPFVNGETGKRCETLRGYIRQLIYKNLSWKQF